MIRHLLMESNISAIMMLKWSWGWAEYAEHAEYAEYAKPQLTSGPLVPLAMFFKLLCHTFYESLVIPYISSWLRSVFVPHCQIWLVCPWGQWHQKELFIDDFRPNLFARIEPVRIWLAGFFHQVATALPQNQAFLLEQGGLIQIFRYCKRLPSDWSRAGLHKDHLVGRLTRKEEWLVQPVLCIV